MSADVDPQDEGASDRLYYGIDGTMGDAQDRPHPYIESVHGSYCRVCGMSRALKAHATHGEGSE